MYLIFHYVSPDIIQVPVSPLVLCHCPSTRYRRIVRKGGPFVDTQRVSTRAASSCFPWRFVSFMLSINFDNRIYGESPALQ